MEARRQENRTQAAVESNGGGWRTQTWAAGTEVWFAGVTFRFVAPFSFLESSLPFEAQAGPAHAPPSSAHVQVEPPQLPSDRSLSRNFRWVWQGALGREVDAGSNAAVDVVAPGQYAARGLDTISANDFLTCLVGAVLGREGGLILHACVAELDGQGVAFVGPSGAGKTTSAMQTRSARLLAKDQAAVFVANGRWWVAAMPGGTEPPCAMPPAAARCLPLGGVLTVRKTVGSPTVQPLGGAVATTGVLSAVRVASTDVEGYGRTLDAAQALAEHVPVGELHSVLGADLGPCIRQWLKGHHG